MDTDGRTDVPELPEVETVVRSLRPKLRQARLGPVWWSGLPAAPVAPARREGHPAHLRRARVADVRRRAKYILIDVEARGAPARRCDGAPGNDRAAAGVPSSSPRRAAHAPGVALGDGRELRFVDPRRFGWVAAADALDEMPELRALGPDPLQQLDAPALAAALAQSRAPDQGVPAGPAPGGGSGQHLRQRGAVPGRRAPHHAGPAGARPGGGAGRRQSARRWSKGSPTAAPRSGTTSTPTAKPAATWPALLVYGREGEPCRTCAAPVRRRVDANRSTFFCPKCQRR
jgi:formamidopyrimidine-DNA glycosylase